MILAQLFLIGEPEPMRDLINKIPEELTPLIGSDFVEVKEEF